MDDHPLTHDRWATPDDPEFCTVRFADFRKNGTGVCCDLGYCSNCGERRE